MLHHKPWLWEHYFQYWEYSVNKNKVKIKKEKEWRFMFLGSSKRTCTLGGSCKQAPSTQYSNNKSTTSVGGVSRRLSHSALLGSRGDQPREGGHSASYAAPKRTLGYLFAEDLMQRIHRLQKNGTIKVLNGWNIFSHQNLRTQEMSC